MSLPTRHHPRSALVVAVACAACGSTTTAPVVEDAVTVEVLFAGIDSTGDFDGRARLDALPIELARSPVDVLCLQGIASPGDRASVKSALAKVYPTSLDLATDDDSPVDDPRDATGVSPPAPATPPCKGEVESSLVQIQTCLLQNGCLGERNVIRRKECLESSLCAPDSLFAADPERRCRSCLVGHARAGASILEAAFRCREQNHPLASKGQHGMMILSKLPLSRPSLVVLPAESTRRAIVGGTITTAGGGQVDVFCASLGPSHPSALPTDPNVLEPYTGAYGAPRDGWVRENALQIEKLAAHVSATRAGRPAVVLGNFGASAEVLRNGRVILPASGPLGAARLDELFASGVATTYAPGCTVCPDNAFSFNAAPSFDNRIYLAGLPQSAVRSSVRSYLGEVLPSDPKSYRGRAPITMQYGFRSTIAVPSR